MLTLLLLLLTVGLARADVIDDMAPNTWRQLPGTKIRSVAPPIAPYGATGLAAVITAWSGAAYDEVNDALWIWGGGHQDYAGNELYRLSLKTLKMERVTDPTPNQFIDFPAAGTGAAYADGNPRSKHTYSGMAFLNGKFFAHGGSNWSYNGGMQKDTWEFDPSTKTWKRLANIDSCYPGFTRPYGARDPLTNTILMHKYVKLCEYTPATNTWRSRGGFPAGADPFATMTFDPVNRLLLLIGKGLRYYDMKSASSNIPMQTMTTIGDQTAVNAEWPGCDWHPPSKSIVCWAGGKSVYALDTKTATWTKTTASASSLTPNSPAPRGTHGRWRWTGRGVFVVVNSVDQDAWVYKPLPVGGLPNPATGLSVQWEN